MSNAMQRPVLVLNHSFEPLAICGARRALVLVVKDVASVEADTGMEVYAGIMLPTVIRLKRFRRVPHRVQILTRKNLLNRDDHLCQYCGQTFPPYRLTLDHVLPRSRGGKSTWENLVAACGPCNRRKADRTPAEAGMPLLRAPRPVSIHTSRHILRAHGREQESWKRYLYY